MKEKSKRREDMPIASEILKDYKSNNKKLFIIIVILLTIIFVETTYLIILLDSLNTSIGTIREEVTHLDG